MNYFCSWSSCALSHMFKNHVFPRMHDIPNDLTGSFETSTKHILHSTPHPRTPSFLLPNMNDILPGPNLSACFSGYLFHSHPTQPTQPVSRGRSEPAKSTRFNRPVQLCRPSVPSEECSTTSTRWGNLRCKVWPIPEAEASGCISWICIMEDTKIELNKKKKIYIYSTCE